MLRSYISFAVTNCPRVLPLSYGPVGNTWAGLSLLRVVPVSQEDPAKEEGVLGLGEYVRLHLALTDDENALSRAVEMLAVAEKWSETGRQ